MPSKTVLDAIYSYQTKLQGVANDLAIKLQRVISRSDDEILKKLLRELPRRKSDIRQEMRRLEALINALSDIRVEAFDEVISSTLDTSKELIGVSEDHEKAVSELNWRNGRFNKKLSKKRVSDILDYQPIDGQSIRQWFSSLQSADLQRLTQAVQSAAVDGLSLSDIVKKIRGTKGNNYTDGMLNATHDSAKMIARTIVNGVSNNARLESMMANSDVIDGVKYLATLDGRTCPFCAAYDNKIWTKNEFDQIRRPPLHRNCRCTLIPYIDLGEGAKDERPAANADFMKLAEESYNENGGNRQWNELAQSTKMKYYYQAQKDYTARTGEPPYRQVASDTTFADYFSSQPKDFQRSWLGKTRYQLYSDGKLPLDKLVVPSTGHVCTIDELKPKK